jgi:hypothetical protein
VKTIDSGTYRLIIADAPGETLVAPAAALGSALEPGDAHAVADLRR